MLMRHFEGWCRKHTYAAVRRVSAELGSATPVVDDHDADAIATRLYIGVDDGESTLVGCIDRFASIDRSRPDVDFLHFVNTTLCRDAEQLVRRRTDDPHIGRQFRRFAPRHPDPELAELIERYNSQGVVDRIGRRRAAKALMPSHAPAFQPLVDPATGREWVGSEAAAGDLHVLNVPAQAREHLDDRRRARRKESA